MAKGTNMDNAAVAESSLKQMADYLENISFFHFSHLDFDYLTGFVLDRRL